MKENDDEILGEPLNTRDVAEMLGVSVWTVKQRLVRQGLPHWRSGPSGKRIFYKQQVIRWLLQRQKQGGTTAWH